MIKFSTFGVLLIVLSVLSIPICADLLGIELNGNAYTNGFKGRNSQQSAVEGLIQRLMPEDVDKFAIEVDFRLKSDDKDVFTIEKDFSESPLRIKASSGVAAAAGLHHYLKYFCQAQVSWDFNQLNLTKCTANRIYEKIEFNDRYRYYQNACTPSYSFVWYDWSTWERHIDWMVLQGFNLVPAQNGQEEIWRRVYSKLGMTREEIDEHLAGPAFLAWNRMGNIRGWGGPLSMSWHAQQVELNQKIIRRMRDFGITTILPAFAGQVPRALKRLYPNATYYEMNQWNGFNDSYCCPYLLNPTEELFKEIGTLFLTEIIKEFGTDHIYNCDTFNEMTPFTTDLDQLRQIGQAIYSSMTLVDPEAIWLLQGWLFHYESDYWIRERVESFITSVPLGKMIILDLQSEQNPQYERLDNYFGQPYIWCMLHDFGGTLSMFGSAEIINNKVFEARNANKSTLIGTGITPEGIDQNYVVYDLMNEMSYRKNPTNLSEWFRNYAIRRYGFENENISKAWDILLHTVYNFNGSQMMRGKFVYNRSPRTKIIPWTWYDHEELNKAQKLFYQELNQVLDSKNCYHDYVDITRQVLQNLLDNVYENLILEFQTKHLDNFLELKEHFLQLFDLVEDILSTDEKWLLGKWLNAARLLASCEEEANLFEYNARNQITLWGPKGEIMDYANKQWSGVVKDFFKPRWELFLGHMEDSLRHGTKFNENGAREDVFEKIEKPFTFSRKQYPSEPTEKSKEILNEIQRKLNEALQNATKFNIVEGRQRKLKMKKRRNRTSS